MRKIFTHLALAFGMAAAALPASAQFAKPEDAVKYRQSALAVMGAHFARIGAMANGRVPFDAKVAADNAELVATLSKLPWRLSGRAPTRWATPRASRKSGPSRPSSRTRLKR